MSHYEKDGNKTSTPRQKVIHNPIPLFLSCILYTKYVAMFTGTLYDACCVRSLLSTKLIQKASVMQELRLDENAQKARDLARHDGLAQTSGLLIRGGGGVILVFKHTPWPLE